MAHHAKIMAHQHKGQAQIADQITQQIDDLRLHGNIQRTHGFIADDQARIAGKRAGNRDALALAAREFMRPAPSAFRPQANTAQQIRNAARFLGTRHQPMQAERFGNGLRHGHARIKAAERVLENNLHVAPTCA